MNNITPVVKNLLIINVIFFLGKLIFANLHPNYYLGAFYFDSGLFQVWQPITYMFMHGDVTHIFFNMFGLFMIGGILENHFGSKRFLNFYMITGLGALALQWGVQAFEVYQITGSIFNPNAVTVDLTAEMAKLNLPNLSPTDGRTILDIYSTPMVGASGAVFGVMTAFAVLYPNIELYIMFIPIPVKAKYFVPAYIVFELVMGFGRFQGDSVAHFAHLGGALVGFILVKLWRNKNNYYDYYD